MDPRKFKREPSIKLTRDEKNMVRVLNHRLSQLLRLPMRSKLCRITTMNTPKMLTPAKRQEISLQKRCHEWV